MRWVRKTMDTTKLVVGQKVCIASGPYGALVTVVEVSPEGMAIVRIDPSSTPTSDNELMRFGSNGVACDSSDLGYTGPKADGIPCSFECGLPWELHDSDSASFRESQERSRLNNIEHSA